MNNGAELDELLDFALALARGAGEISLKYFKKSLTPERKGDGSPVTIADREAERFIRARIEERFPRDAILGEEEASRAGLSGRQWIVDPIDGTYSFI
ncbi:MAG TPA: inositol monophosphatase family protein, partial [Pyrinomonadaceae bacterium]|nr:inositol monophosphatase family protein [Pyrinomonadaceae bacterium]